MNNLAGRESNTAGRKNKREGRINDSPSRKNDRVAAPNNSDASMNDPPVPGIDPEGSVAFRRDGKNIVEGVHWRRAVILSEVVPARRRRCVVAIVRTSAA